MKTTPQERNFKGNFGQENPHTIILVSIVCAIHSSISPIIHVTFEKLQNNYDVFLSFLASIFCVRVCSLSRKLYLPSPLLVLHSLYYSWSSKYFLFSSAFIFLSLLLAREMVSMLKTTIPWVLTKLWKRFSTNP